MPSVRTLVFVLGGAILLDGCSHAVHAGREGAVCAAAPERPADEPLFKRARELLTDSTSAQVRTEYALTGNPQAVQWVTDDATCARLASAVAAGEPSNTTMPVAAVHAGNFYLVRTDPLGSDWLLSDRFKVLAVFVVPS